MIFTFNEAPPAIPASISPSGVIGDTTPTYTWSQVDDATIYCLVVYDLVVGNYPILVKLSPSVCSGGTCAYTPDTSLELGKEYKWKVLARNVLGYQRLQRLDDLYDQP